MGVVLLGSMIALALAAPLFGDPYAIPADGLSVAGLPRGVFSPGHLLGTDQLGRDMLARTAYGARASLEIAFISNITSSASARSSGSWPASTAAGSSRS